MEGFDPLKFTKQWHAIEHNVHSLKGQCVNVIDTFSQSGSTLIMSKTCRNSSGKQSVEIGEVIIPDQNVRSKMVIKYKGVKALSGTVSYNVYSTDYDTFAIVGPDDKKSFVIMSTKPTMELCKLAELEMTVGKMGFDVSDVIRCFGAVIPCKGAAK